jgi:hypothetical protein
MTYTKELLASPLVQQQICPSYLISNRKFEPIQSTFENAGDVAERVLKSIRSTETSNA